MASSSKSSGATPESIEQFCAITSASSDVALRMLEACNGNIEMAINMHVDAVEGENIGLPLESLPSTSSTAAANSLDNKPMEEDAVRAPIPPTRGILVDEPLMFRLGSTRRPPRSIFDGFRDFEAETRRQEQELWNPKSLESSQRKRTLEDLFRPPVDLMHKGTFESARDHGQYTNKWLMVNIQNVQEFACQMLNRDVWSNSAVKSIIQEHFIFFQVYHDSDEGQRYMRFYKVLDWPYISVLDPRTGENLVVWNKVDPISFCDLVTEFLSEHPMMDGSNPSSPPKKRQKTPSIVDASEDSQLEAAIRASLCESKNGNDSEEDENVESDCDVETFDSDDEKIDHKNTDSRPHKKGMDPNSNVTSSKISNQKGSESKNHAKVPNLNSTKTPTRLNSVKRSAETNSNKCSVENISHTTEERCSQQANSCRNDGEAEAASCSSNSNSCDSELWKQYLGLDDDVKSNVVMRFPDGKKKQLCLPASSSLKALVLYVESHGFPSDKYELVTNFPRRQLSQLEMTLTLKEAGLFPQETIFVQAR